MITPLDQRIEVPEWLDAGTIATPEIQRFLDELRRMNRWLFGVQATLAPLQVQIQRLSEPVTVLDLGTGSGQMAQRLRNWA